MDLINLILNSFDMVIEFTNSINFFITIIIIIIFYHILLHFLRDRTYIKILQKYYEPEKITINDLKSLPLVNIIIPAWNKGVRFKECLQSITKLTYPNLKIIINAGGSEETVKIANSFKKIHDNSIILHQEKGPYLIQGKNKIRALNKCFKHVSKGILYLIDADCYLTDEILLRMLYPIINENENVVCGENRPLKAIENKDLVKYLLINSIGYFNGKFSRYWAVQVAGSNTCLTYQVIKKIGEFNERGVLIEEISRARDITSKGFKIYHVKDFRSAIYTDFPINFRGLYAQRSRYVKYKLIYNFLIKEKKPVIKTLLLFTISIYILISPIFLFFHIGLFFIGIGIFLSFYLKRIRKLTFFKILINPEFYAKFGSKFPIKMIFYTFIEIILNVIILIKLIPFIKRVKREISNYD